MCLQKIAKIDISPEFQILFQEGKETRPCPSYFSISIVGLGNQLPYVQFELVAITI
jgi:hypothetical protein